MIERYGTSLHGRFGYQNESLVYYGDEGRETSAGQFMAKIEGEG